MRESGAPATYTVDQLMQDWLATLKDKSEKTQKNAKSDAQHIIDSSARSSRKT